MRVVAHRDPRMERKTVLSLGAGNRVADEVAQLLGALFERHAVARTAVGRHIEAALVAADGDLDAVAGAHRTRSDAPVFPFLGASAVGRPSFGAGLPALCRGCLAGRTHRTKPVDRVGLALQVFSRRDEFCRTQPGGPPESRPARLSVSDDLASGTTGTSTRPSCFRRRWVRDHRYVRSGTTSDTLGTTCHRVAFADDIGPQR